MKTSIFNVITTTVAGEYHLHPTTVEHHEWIRTNIVVDEGLLRLGRLRRGMIPGTAYRICSMKSGNIGLYWDTVDQIRTLVLEVRVDEEYDYDYDGLAAVADVAAWEAFGEYLVSVGFTDQSETLER